MNGPARQGTSRETLFITHPVEGLYVIERDVLFFIHFQASGQPPWWSRLRAISVWNELYPICRDAYRVAAAFVACRRPARGIEFRERATHDERKIQIDRDRERKRENKRDKQTERLMCNAAILPFLFLANASTYGQPNENTPCMPCGWRYVSGTRRAQTFNYLPIMMANRGRRFAFQMVPDINVAPIACAFFIRTRRAKCIVL